MFELMDKWKLPAIEDYYSGINVKCNYIWAAHSFTNNVSLPTGEQSDIVKIRGPKEDVDQCYNFLKRMLRDLLESNYQVKVSIFRQFHKFVIGKAGANINKVNMRINCSVKYRCKWISIFLPGYLISVVTMLICFGHKVHVIN